VDSLALAQGRVKQEMCLFDRAASLRSRAEQQRRDEGFFRESVSEWLPIGLRSIELDGTEQLVGPVRGSV
jgi:hypothetical protein